MNNEFVMVSGYYKNMLYDKWNEKQIILFEISVSIKTYKNNAGGKREWKV